MRLVKIHAPVGRGKNVMQIAFSSGIHKVSLYNSTCHNADGTIKGQDVVDIETSTPKAKLFVDELLKADFFDRDEFALTLRQPRSIFFEEGLGEITRPLAEPSTDLLEELWQFSHLTYGLAIRVFIAACLLAYGLIQQQILLIIGGLLFLPLLPILLAIGFGAWSSQWKLVVQGLATFAVSILVLVGGGMVVAAITSPPLRYSEFSSIPTSLLISSIVGIAAGFSSIDDAGRRELIGLAAAAQIGVIPVWVAVYIIFGLTTDVDEQILETRILSFVLNVLGIVVTSLGVFVITRVVNNDLSRVRKRKTSFSPKVTQYPTER